MVLSVYFVSQHIVEVRSDKVCVLFLLVLVVFHLCSEGKPSQVHGCDFLLLGKDLTGILILHTLKTIEGVN